MTAEQLLEEVKALPDKERERFLVNVLALAEEEVPASEIPAEFLEAMNDFDNSRFVSMDTAFNAVPPGM